VKPAIGVVRKMTRAFVVVDREADCFEAELALDLADAIAQPALE
jgi:hypothetical protein